MTNILKTGIIFNTIYTFGKIEPSYQYLSFIARYKCDQIYCIPVYVFRTNFDHTIIYETPNNESYVT